jgi:PAS domain S-box-containing protein
MTERTPSEAKSHASEARYRTLFEYAQVGILLADADSVYIDANPSVCRMLGYSRDELIGLHASDIVAGSEVGHIGVALSELRGDSDHQREWQFRRKDGSVFPADVIATRMPDGALLGMLRDASDRKRADGYRAHLAAIVESSSDAIVGKDLNGVVTSWNAGAEAMFGYAAAEMMGTSIERVIPEDRRQEEDLILAKLRRGERVETFETLRQARDGRLIDVSIAVSPIHDVVGQTVGASKVARDITALKQREREIRSEKLFSDTMIESMPGVFYFYDATGRFLRWNRNFETVSGYSGEEIARMHPLDFVAVGERARVEQRIADVFETGEASIEATFVAKNGRSTPYLFTGTRILCGNAACVVGVGIDISQRKRAEMDLRELNQTLEGKVVERTEELQEATTRAEAADHIKSAFLASMSHELRTPLNAIIGFTGTLLQDLAGPLNQEQRKQLEIVRGSGRHLLALVNDVLDISKIEAGHLEVACEPFDLPCSMARVLGIVAPLAEKKGLALQTRISSELNQAVGDERRFEQILLNLLSNAIKFTERGEVVLAAERISDFKLPGSDAMGPAVRVRVTDTGGGIKPEDLVTLFQPFRQIDSSLSRSHEGTGLGLAICRRLATLMGGAVAAESVPGKGSIFIVTLPLERLAAPAAVPDP